MLTIIAHAPLVTVVKVTRRHRLTQLIWLALRLLHKAANLRAWINHFQSWILHHSVFKLLRESNTAQCVNGASVILVVKFVLGDAPVLAVRMNSLFHDLELFSGFYVFSELGLLFARQIANVLLHEVLYTLLGGGLLLVEHLLVDVVLALGVYELVHMILHVFHSQNIDYLRSLSLVFLKQ